VIAGHSIERLITLQAGRRVHLTVEENAAVAKMHFRRKTTIEESRFLSADYRIYANA
jgi:hypothetical protein